MKKTAKTTKTSRRKQISRKISALLASDLEQKIANLEARVQVLEAAGRYVPYSPTIPPIPDTIWITPPIISHNDTFGEREDYEL